MTPEGKVKAEIKKGLEALGIYYFMPVQSGYGKRALDFICCYKGLFIAIEAKSGTNTPSKFQQTTMQQMEKAGAYTAVAYCWNDVIHLLRLVDTDLELE